MSGLICKMFLLFVDIEKMSLNYFASSRVHKEGPPEGTIATWGLVPTNFCPINQTYAQIFYILKIRLDSFEISNLVLKLGNSIYNCLKDYLIKLKILCQSIVLSHLCFLTFQWPCIRKNCRPQGVIHDA